MSNLVTRSYKYRIYPTKCQEIALLDALTKHRRLYNAALEQRQVAYRQNRLEPLTEILARKMTREERLRMIPLQTMAFSWRSLLSDKGMSLSFFGQSVEVKNVKRSPGFAGQDSYSLGLTLKRLDKSYKAFFKGGGFPKFKNSSTFRSLNYKIGSGAKIGEKLYLHGIGTIRVNWHRELPEGCKPRQVSVKFTPSGKWVVCVQLDTAITTPENHDGPEVGIDWGITQLAVLTDGLVIESVKAFESARKKLRSQQRVMSRRAPKPGQPASNGYKSAKRLVAITHETIANIRADFNHKVSRYLVEKYGRIVVEKLAIAKMVQSEPSSGPLSKRDLNRGCLDSAWAQLCDMLHYKAEETGCDLVDVDPALTTRTCTKCGFVATKAITTATWKCSGCGFKHVRKKNSAQNILEKGNLKI